MRRLPRVGKTAVQQPAVIVPFAEHLSLFRLFDQTCEGLLVHLSIPILVVGYFMLTPYSYRLFFEFAKVAKYHFAKCGLVLLYLN